MPAAIISAQRVEDRLLVCLTKPVKLNVRRMAILVHITSEEYAKSISRSGIRPGKYNPFVFFMPLAGGYNIAYQWGREIKRGGSKNLVAVQFKLESNELVWFGRYNASHEQASLGDALKRFRLVDDKLGYEFFVEGKVSRSRIHRIKSIRKPSGWRYFPEAHGRKPCFCPACVSIGEPKSGRRRREWIKENEGSPYNRKEAREILAASTDAKELGDAIWALGGKDYRGSPEFIFRALPYLGEYGLYAAIELIGKHKHPVTEKFLRSYQSDDQDVNDLINELLSKSA